MEETRGPGTQRAGAAKAISLTGKALHVDRVPAHTMYQAELTFTGSHLLKPFSIFKLLAENIYVHVILTDISSREISHKLTPG